MYFFYIWRCKELCIQSCLVCIYTTGTVNTQSFVWKFALYIIFIHSSFIYTIYNVYISGFHLLTFCCVFYFLVVYMHEYNDSIVVVWVTSPQDLHCRNWPFQNLCCTAKCQPFSNVGQRGSWTRKQIQEEEQNSNNLFALLFDPVVPEREMGLGGVRVGEGGVLWFYYNSKFIFHMCTWFDSAIGPKMCLNLSLCDLFHFVSHSPCIQPPVILMIWKHCILPSPQYQLQCLKFIYSMCVWSRVCLIMCVWFRVENVYMYN